MSDFDDFIAPIKAAADVVIPVPGHTPGKVLSVEQTMALRHWWENRKREDQGEVITYCPACRGHGTDVHECEELRSVVVAAADLRYLLDVYIENGMMEPEDEAIVERLWRAVKALEE